MNDASEWLVGGVAIVLSLWIGFGTLRQSPSLYRLRRVAEMRARFGNRGAATILLGVAALLLGTGVMILGGIRPGYAMPSDSEVPRHEHGSDLP